MLILENFKEARNNNSVVDIAIPPLSVIRRLDNNQYYIITKLMPFPIFLFLLLHKQAKRKLRGRETMTTRGICEAVWEYL